MSNKVHHTRESLIQNKLIKAKIGSSKCDDYKHIEGFKCPAMNDQCKTCHKYGHFTSLCFKKQVAFKSRASKAPQLQAEEIYMQDNSICSQSDGFTFSDDFFCLQMQIQYVQAKPNISTTSHLIINLAYRLQPYNKQNQYLRACLDTCSTYVNIMPTSVYKLVFSDPDLKKLAPSKLEIGTYTIDTVK